MTVYVDGLGEAITVETARAFAENRLGRKLTLGELHLDLIGLDVDLEHGKARLVAAIEQEKRRAIVAYLRDGHPPILHLTDAMLTAIDGLVEAGRAHARAEMRSMGVAPFRAFAEADDRRQETLREILAALNSIRARLTEEARGIEFQGRSGSEITEALIEKLDKRIPGSRDIASRVVSGLLLGGLGEVYETNADLFPGFTYSAVMDASTCSVCATYDGRVYRTWVEGEVDLPGGGPNPFCLGDGRCRCRLVPLPPGATLAPPAPEPEPEPSTPMEQLTRDVRDFDRLTDEEMVELMRPGQPDSTLVGINGYANREFREREARMRDLGRRIEEQASLRDEGAFDHERLAAFDREVDRSRDGVRDELNRHYDLAQGISARIERELFGDRGASNNQEFDRLDRAVRSDPELLASQARLDEIQAAHWALMRERDRHVDPVRIHAESRRAVLDEIHALGDARFGRRTEDLDASGDRARLEADGYRRLLDPLLYDVADEQARFLPTDWIEESNSRLGGFVVGERDRGRYNSRLGLLAVSGTGDAQASTMLHELGHRMEHVIPEIRMWEWVFGSRRIEESDAPELQRLSALRPGLGYGDDELTNPDDFPNPYTGRDYGREPASSTEFLSMGLEGLFHDSVIDDDHRDFVLGLLATVRRPRTDVRALVARAGANL